MLARPAGERIGLVIADMADRICGIDRFEAGKRHDMPTAVDVAPMAGRLPTLIGDGRKAVRQPQRGGRVAVILHEGEPFGRRDEVAVDSHRTDESPVRGLLIVEMKTVIGVADGVDAFLQLHPCVSVTL